MWAYCYFVMPLGGAADSNEERDLCCFVMPLGGAADSNEERDLCFFVMPLGGAADSNEQACHRFSHTAYYTLI